VCYRKKLGHLSQALRGMQHMLRITRAGALRIRTMEKRAAKLLVVARKTAIVERPLELLTLDYFDFLGCD